HPEAIISIRALNISHDILIGTFSMVLLLQRARLDPIRYIQRDFITTKGTIRSYSLHSVRSHTLKGTIRTYSLHSVRSHTLKGTIRLECQHSVRSHTLKGTIKTES